MGKRIRVQRRGRGGQNWRASTHKRVAPAKYPAIAPKESFDAELVGVILDLVHDPGRGSPLSLIEFDNGISIYSITPEGVFTGQEIVYGGKAPAEIGNILPLGKMPEGTLVCDYRTPPRRRRQNGSQLRRIRNRRRPYTTRHHDPLTIRQNTLYRRLLPSNRRRNLGFRTHRETVP